MGDTAYKEYQIEKECLGQDGPDLHRLGRGGGRTDVITDQLREVVPDDNEREAKLKTAETAMRLVREVAAGRPEILDVELGGSFAKGTWLSGAADIDVFVRFKRSVPPEAFTKVSKEVGFAAMAGHGPYERYADHPYVEAEMDGTKINVVPCYDVKQGGWKSAADRSPYHTRYMKERLTDTMKNDVRLLKRLLKAQGIYGAQMSKQGFSGYVAEVLTLHFGGFIKTAEAMAGVGYGDIIGDATKVFDTPIVIVDPVDGNRNLAAAISGRNMALFILACRALLRNPAASMFGAGQPPIREDWDDVVAVRFRYSERSPETIWGQAKKATSSVGLQLRRGGFGVIRQDTLVGNQAVHILFLLESTRISSRFVREGPDVFRSEDVDRFVERNGGGMVWVSDDMRVLCVGKRQHTGAVSLLQHLLANPRKTGIPAGLHADLRGGYDVLSGDQLDQSVKRDAAGLVSADEAVLSRG